MIRMIRSLALVAAALLIPVSASALGVSITNVSSTNLSTGDVLTVDLVVENASNIDIASIGIGAWGYDVDGIPGNDLLAFQNADVSTSVFNIGLIGGNPAGGMANQTTGEEIVNNPVFGIPLHLQLLNALDDDGSAPFANGSGEFDRGVDLNIVGNPIGSGDVHFRVQFLADGFDFTTGQDVTLTFGVGEYGNGVVDGNAADISDQFSNATLTVSVIPEPGTAILMGLGLIGLASQRRR